MPGALHDPQLAGWRDQLLAERARVVSIVSPLTTLERHQTPAARAWNVDQVLEHLVIANGLYVVMMSRAMTDQANRASAVHGPWRPSLVGRLLYMSVDPASTRRLPSPRRARPGPEVRSDVLRRFTTGLDDLCALMLRADGVDLQAVRFPSPFASLIKLNLGDGFAICTAHTTRHANQIERTIAAVVA